MAISILPTLTGNDCSLLNAILGNCPIGTYPPSNPPAPAAPQTADAINNWTTLNLQQADLTNWLLYQHSAILPSADTGLDNVLFQGGSIASNVTTQAGNVISAVNSLTDTQNPLAGMNTLLIGGIVLIGGLFLVKILA